MGDYFTLARIVRPRGRVGEVVAEILTDFPERLTRLREVFLTDGRHPPRRIAVRRCWLHLGRAIFHFAGVDSIAEAEKLRGCEVQLPISERVALPAGQYFVADLIGCEVWEAKEDKDVEEGDDVKEVEDENTLAAVSSENSRVAETLSPTSTLSFLGVIRSVHPTGDATPGTALLAVETNRGELLIPFAEDICIRIDVTARRIDVRLPEGLRDLNE